MTGEQMLSLVKRYGRIGGPYSEDCQSFCILKLVQAGASDLTRHYALRVIRNARTDYLRRLRRLGRKESLGIDEVTREGHAYDQEDGEERLIPVILTVDDDACLVLYLWGLHFYQIARVLRLSKNTVAQRVRAAMHERWVEGIHQGGCHGEN